ncbi:hypothetical protein F5Y06DRAFT_293491 [Hypoxylon sp. FL0890]|nr:hypothetical protein F5Y06DRAFT_293491 [Hypoxylon sp. FL0890]
MPRQKVPITFQYQKKGTTPPIYVAGSFSDPPWQTQEMDVSVDQSGENIFTKRVLVDNGSEIQYKFRIGSGNWWALDDSADTVMDGRGNMNNILRVSISGPQEADKKAPNPRVDELKGSAPSSGAQTPDFAKTAAEVAESARILDPETPEPEISDGEAGRIGYRRLSSTPIRQVSDTAMEVADVAAMLDADDSFSDDDIDDDIDDEYAMCPVFSHESVGSNGHDGNDDAGGRRDSKTASQLDNSAIEDVDVDFDDPQLEAFPSANRESILAAVRRISSSIDADRTVVDGIPPSPIVPISQHHKTVDSLKESEVTPGSIDEPPKDKRHLRPKNITKQSGSGHSPRALSMSSLGSIAEDDESHNDGAGKKSDQVTTQFVQHRGPCGSAPERSVSEDSNDEGISMSVESKRKREKSQDFHDSAATAPPTSSTSNASKVAEPTSNESAPGQEDKPSLPTDNNDAPGAPREHAPQDSPPSAVRHTPGTYESDSSNVETTGEGEGMSTSIDAGNQPHLRKQTADRSATPPSTHRLQGPSRTPDWLDACLRLVFVNWIGGLVGWLYGRRHRALLAAGTAALVVGVGLLWQNPIRL